MAPTVPSQASIAHQFQDQFEQPNEKQHQSVVGPNGLYSLQEMKHIRRKLVNASNPKADSFLRKACDFFLSPAVHVVLVFYFCALSSYYIFKLFLGVVAMIKAKAAIGVPDTCRLRSLVYCKLSDYVDAKDKVDFAIHRGPTYLWEQTVGLGKRILELVSGSSTMRLLPDDELFVLLTTSCMAREFEHHGQKMVIDFSKKGLKNMSLYEGLYMDCMRFEYDLTTTRMTLWLRDHSKNEVVPIAQGSKHWDTAKAHLAGTVAFWVEAMTHNWVHFHYQDIACAQTSVVVPEQSVLGTLLSTHLRFTSFINTLGPSSSFFQPMGRQEFMSEALIWKAQPVSQQQFQSNIARNAVKHYINFGNDVHRSNESQWSCEKAFPPLFVRERLARFDEFDSNVFNKLPYLDFCAAYYEVIHRFIGRLHNENLLEADLVDNWKLAMQSGGMPRFASLDTVEVIATLIWTGAVVHGADHLTHYDGILNHGSISTAVPFRTDTNTKPEDVLDGGIFSAVQWQNAKSRTFADWYVTHRDSFLLNDCITNPKLYGLWQNVKYPNQKKRCQQISEEYAHELLVLNESWKWILDVNRLVASTSW